MPAMELEKAWRESWGGRYDRHQVSRCAGIEGRLCLTGGVEESGETGGRSGSGTYIDLIPAFDISHDQQPTS